MTKIEEMERLFKAVKDNGLRKMAWGTMALWVIFILCLLGKLEGMIFAGCFTALVTAVMAAAFAK